MSHAIPFMAASTVTAPKKMPKDVPDLEEAIEEEDEGDVVEPNDAEEDEEKELKTDKLIKKPKAKGKRAPKKKKGDDEEEEKPKKGAKKGAAAKGKGKK